MHDVLERALNGKGSFQTRLKRAAKAIDADLDADLVAVLDLEGAIESRDAFADWFDASVRPFVAKDTQKRTWILGLDDRCCIWLSHGKNHGWGKRAFSKSKGSVECAWADALLDERLPTVAYRRIWIVFLALALQSCDPPKAEWAVSVDELAQAYLGNLDVVEYEEDQ